MVQAAKTLSQLKLEINPPRDDRPSAHKRGYTSKWQAASKSYLKRNRLCVECKKAGRTTVATVTDHIIPHKGNSKLFWDKTNWQALCAKCHGTKTNRHDGGFGRDIKQ